MQQAKKGDKVKVHYHGKLAGGEVFDSSAGREPLEFVIGSGSVIPGFDDGVSGMGVGEKKTINIAFDQAYGPRSSELMFEFSREKFPGDMTVEVGMELMMSDESGQQYPVVVSQLKEKTVILDANHPLAGQDLIFEVELVEVIGGNSGIILP